MTLLKSPSVQQHHGVHHGDSTNLDVDSGVLSLQGNELHPVASNRDDRDQIIDDLLHQFWNQSDKRAWLRNEQQQKQFHLTYGEVKTDGVRQLIKLLKLDTKTANGPAVKDNNSTERRIDTTGDDNNDNKIQLPETEAVEGPAVEAEEAEEPVIFYDLGSGAGKVVVQMILEGVVTASIGVELVEARHRLAVQAWDGVQLQLQLLAEDQKQTSFSPMTYMSKCVPQQNDIKDNATAAFVVETPCVQLRNQDILEADFSDATHVYFSSLCFSDDVVTKVGTILKQNRIQHGKLQVVVALSNITTLEGKENRPYWKKSFEDITSMTWGKSTARIYTYVG